MQAFLSQAGLTYSRAHLYGFNANIFGLAHVDRSNRNVWKFLDGGCKGDSGGGRGGASGGGVSGERRNSHCSGAFTFVLFRGLSSKSDGTCGSSSKSDDNECSSGVVLPKSSMTVRCSRKGECRTDEARRIVGPLCELLQLEII